MPSCKALCTFFLVALACNRSWAVNPDSDSEYEAEDGTLKPKKSAFQRMNQEQYKGWLNHALTSAPDKDHDASSDHSSVRVQGAHEDADTKQSGVKLGAGEHVSSYPLHRHLQKEQNDEQSEGILRKYEGTGKVPRPATSLPEGRAFGSYPRIERGPIVGIEKVAKERRAKSAPWETVGTRGKGLGFPPYTTTEGWHPPGKEPNFNRQGNSLWAKHTEKYGPMNRHDRGDDSRLYHKHANSFVQIHPRLSTQSFNGREERSLQKDLQKFKMHHRQSLTSDGRYSGDGKFYGKSPLVLGAEGARDVSLLYKSLPPEEQKNYRAGQFSKIFRGKALEQEDGHFNIKAHSRLQNWMRERGQLQSMTSNGQREKLEEERKKQEAASYKQRETDRAEEKRTQRQAKGYDPSKAPWQSFFPGENKKHPEDKNL